MDGHTISVVILLVVFFVFGIGMLSIALGKAKGRADVFKPRQRRQGKKFTQNGWH